MHVLDKYGSDKESLKASCLAIRKLASYKENSDRLGELGACKRIIKLLKKHKGDEDIQKCLCSSILRLGSRNVNNRGKIRDAWKEQISEGFQH